MKCIPGCLSALWADLFIRLKADRAISAMQVHGAHDRLEHDTHSFFSTIRVVVFTTTSRDVACTVNANYVCLWREPTLSAYTEDRDPSTHFAAMRCRF
jgi:hypothetical protein